MKRQYITNFTWEDYKPGDKLIYKNLSYSVSKIDNYDVWYEIDSEDINVFLANIMVICIGIRRKDILTVKGEVSLSEIQIDRTPNLLIQLYHYIIDLWN